MHGHHVPARICRQVAISQRIAEEPARRAELAAQLADKAALLGLDDSAGVMRDQRAQHWVGALDVAEVPGAVERMKAALDQLGRVADVMQPRGSFQKIGVLAKDRGKGPGSRGDPLDVVPAAWKRYL